MDMSSHRQSACDRCRGQKLRCAGLANPVHDRHSRYVRNQTPCDRCRKAQVECYSIRPIPRKRDTSGSLSSNTTSGHNPSNNPVYYLPLHSPQSTLSPLDNPPRSDNDDPDILSTAPFTGQPSLDGVSADAIPGLSNNSLSDNPYDFAIEDFLAEETNLSEESPITSDVTGKSVHVEKSPGTSMILDYVKQLAELNGILLHNRANRHETWQGDQTQSQPFASQSGSLVSLSIGQTLSHCQHLLGILQNIQRNVTSQASEDSWPVGRSDYGLVFPFPVISTDRANRKGLPAASLDLSSLFSILACYAYIMEDLELLFSTILESLTQATPRVPATLVGTSLDGFKLDGNNTLQLEFVLYVSSNLLGKIESILIGTPKGMTGGSKSNGLLSGKMAGYLESMYDHNDRSTEEATGGGEIRARALIRQIQTALKKLDI